MFVYIPRAIVQCTQLETQAIHEKTFIKLKKVTLQLIIKITFLNIIICTW